MQACLLCVVLVTFCSAADETNVMVPLEDPAPIVEIMNPEVSGDSTSASGRPKRQFLAGLVVGSLLSGGGGYGYGRPYYGGGYGGYGYGRPHYGGGYGYRRPYGHYG